MNEIKLKPCPFCGEKENLEFNHSCGDLVYVRCGRCTAFGPSGEGEDGAADEWNRRAEIKEGTT